jgi:ABC-type enterochelin transport system permease subunit
MNEISDPKSLNIWDYKPWWCQPWSILLTGIIIVSGGWFITRILWLTVILSILIVVWWGYFLIIYPRLFRQYLEQELKNLPIK